MTIEIRPHDTRSLMGFYQSVEAPVNYFRNLLVDRVYLSDAEEVVFSKITKTRKLAPLVIPTAPGRAMYTEEPQRIYSLKPAYLKPKDAIRPERALKRRNKENLFTANTLSPYQRYQQILGDILADHREGIDNYTEWQTAQAALYGAVTLEGPDYPKRTIDFGRDLSHTVTLATDKWSDPETPILDMIQDWINKIRRADFGGPVTRITVGRDVVPFLLKNKQIQAERSLIVRDTDVHRPSLFRKDDYAEKVLEAGGLEFWTTSDWYTAPDGTVKQYMPDSGVLLTGPRLDMVECYGAILDASAQLQVTPVFIKQWEQQDPSATFVMTQSAPLVVPVNPNNTLFATVL